MDFSNIKKENCCLSSSFPKVEKNKKDDKVVKKLLDIYAGSKGELTAVCQYMYESFYTKPTENYTELSDILEKISICEMKHVEIISQILLSMGINPKFCKYIDNNYNICNYWSTGNVKYITDIQKFIDYNIKLENCAIQDYNELLTLTNSQNIKNIVNIIIKDEEGHLEIFEELKIIFNKKNRAIDLKIDEQCSTKEEIVNMFTTNSNYEPNNINERTLNDSKNNLQANNQIQISVSDITNLSSEELEYQRKLKEKSYLPNEIIDG